MASSGKTGKGKNESRASSLLVMSTRINQKGTVCCLVKVGYRI